MSKLKPCTCEVVGIASQDWSGGVMYEIELSCGHTVVSLDSESPKYCPTCGRKVVDK